MTVADWALIISFGSLIISLASFIWNIWSKFIYPKPKIRVSIRIMNMVPNYYNRPPFTYLDATNFGPGEITLQLAIARKKRTGIRMPPIALLNPIKNFPVEFNISDGPYSGGLPKKIAAGEQFAVYFPLSKEWVEEKLVFFGFNDSYGRNHWCSKKIGTKFLKELTKHPALVPQAETQ